MSCGVLWWFFFVVVSFYLLLGGGPAPPVQLLVVADRACRETHHVPIYEAALIIRWQHLFWFQSCGYLSVKRTLFMNNGKLKKCCRHVR